ncbi:DNA/RNA nuclease SfsA [Aedoeadaptatus pacaensis]|uniref:DNA/RNA nuclease SfsA n=1 Tax=Aedoeadaptatus pacaensis TaxID=1776390 RepID=UPI000837F62E|nr:DNA/RNA nuclease SfsA [Peptoniphilus pacaensis]
MKYKRMEEAIFLNRENRFIAMVEKDDKKIRVHVPNTGRCRELFIPGAKVLLDGADPARKRKTPYSLVTVYKGDLPINIDSQAPNQLAAEYFDGAPYLKGFGKILSYEREVKHGNSRFDFYLKGTEGEGFLEVKGVTLEEVGLAKFPDAPTMRGAKHIRELGDMATEGKCCGVLFVVQMKGIWGFTPNVETDPEFTQALREAEEKGLHIFVVDTIVDGAEMEMDKAVPYFKKAPLSLVKTREEELPVVVNLIDSARAALKIDGVDQWQGVVPTPEELLENIKAGCCYFFKDDTVAGMAVLKEGADPTYGSIDGEWLTEGDYLTIHQFVVAENKRGEGMSRRMMERIFTYVRFKGIPAIRIDTHADNFRMRGLIESTGFTYCGVITVADGTERVAYEQVIL